jgi:LCP family protein required for cell wall assembly
MHDSDDESSAPRSRFAGTNSRARIPYIVSIAGMGLLAAIASFMLFRHPIEAVQHQVDVRTSERAFGTHKLNLLLLGYQADEATTDTVLLAHLDVDRRTATLVSIPRDTWVKIPGHGSDKINAAYAYGGTKLAAKVVSSLMNAPVDATIALQPEGAAAIVDAMGGLNLNVDEDMNYDDSAGDLHIHLQHGLQHLTGSQVLGYIRFRHDDSGDFGRVRRQQQVLKAMLDQLSEPQNWVKLPRILALARKNITTPLSTQKLAALLQLYRSVPDNDIRTFTLPARVGWVGDASVVFVDEHWSHLIGALLFGKKDPPQDAVLVANATGNKAFDRAIVAALRGGGWNVPTFLDQPPKKVSRIVGSSPAAQALAVLFNKATRSDGKETVLLLGLDVAPEVQ